jgi:uncharacterized protein (DUF433 family)
VQIGIHDRGRGPEIIGTRITVYDIMDYLEMGWHHTTIAARLRLSSDQVIAAIEYIKGHEAEVRAEYQKMLERDARGNPPELQAKLDAIRAKYAPLFEELKRKHEAKKRHAQDNGRS